MAPLTDKHVDLVVHVTLHFSGVKSELSTVISNVQEGKYFSFFINSVLKIDAPEPDNALDFFQLKRLFLWSCFR